MRNKQNLFLPRVFFIIWNDSESAFGVKSPNNKNGVIWWSAGWYQASRWPDYFATGIIHDREYDEIIYENITDLESRIVTINKIPGELLVTQYKKLLKDFKKKNEFIQFSNNLRIYLKNLQNDQLVITHGGLEKSLNWLKWN